MDCDQCVAVMVNGVYCHEHGCPNIQKSVVEDFLDGMVTCYEQRDERMYPKDEERR
jgi:hypothetical protein